MSRETKEVLADLGAVSTAIVHVHKARDEVARLLREGRIRDTEDTRYAASFLRLSLESLDEANLRLGAVEAELEHEAAVTGGRAA